MRIKEIVDEDFVNYNKPSMLVATCFCDWKCCIEDARCKCQNSEMADAPIVEYEDYKLIQRFLNNQLTEAVVFGGLEPMLQFQELLKFVKLFREKSDADVVVYTGYFKEEIEDKVSQLSKFKNIIIKFGRFKCGQKPHLDKILGIYLANDEQHAERIS